MMAVYKDKRDYRKNEGSLMSERSRKAIVTIACRDNHVEVNCNNAK